MDSSDKEKGRRGTIDRLTGEVRGSGSGAGGGNAGEDYDQDPMAGAGADPAARPMDAAVRDGKDRGHPLPSSAEARHGEIPETAERAKGHGEDVRERVQPADEAVDPNGEPYPPAGSGR